MLMKKNTVKKIAVIAACCTIGSIWIYPIFEPVAKTSAQHIALIITSIAVGAFSVGAFVEALIALDRN